MFHWDRGLKLTRADLAIDFRRRQPRGFISHAHTDHMARHELALCTPATSRLYQFRLGTRPVLELPYRQTVEWGHTRLTTYPAGHCLGSAMLLAEDDSGSLLYTGDFKLEASATAETAELPRADLLVMESTYGDPRHRRVPRQQVVAELVGRVGDTLSRGLVPVIEAYTLGKSQEVTRILTQAGIGVLQHPAIFDVSRVYTACGVELGGYEKYPGYPRAGHAVVVPPTFHRQAALPRLKQAVRFAVTGWAAAPGAAGRLGVDHALPLSDHADFGELLAAVEMVAPRVVYATHGPAGFVDHLRRAGWDARQLGSPGGLSADDTAPWRQAELFPN